MDLIICWWAFCAILPEFSGTGQDKESVTVNYLNYNGMSVKEF